MKLKEVLASGKWFTCDKWEDWESPNDIKNELYYEFGPDEHDRDYQVEGDPGISPMKLSLLDLLKRQEKEHQ